MIGEVEPDRGAHLLGFTGGLQMHVEDEFVARVESPGESLRFEMGNSARFPEQKIAIGIGRVSANDKIHAWESLAGQGLVQMRGSGTVDEKVGVMDARLAG